MQTLHRQCGDRLELDPLHAGMLRLVTDCFSRVTLAAPVMLDYTGPTVAYPDSFAFSVLFRRRRHTSRLRLALLHAASLPVMARAIRAADIVHVRLPSYSALAGGILALLLGRKVIASFHGSSDGGLRHGHRSLAQSLAAAASRRGYRRISRHAILNLVSGPRVAAQISGPACLVGHHQFREQDLATRGDTCQGPVIRLLYVGRLSREKGTLCLLDAFHALHTTDPRLQLTLVGESWKLRMDEEIRARGLAGAVSCTGPLAFGPELFAAYRAADLLVFPSLHEGVPKVPMEAMSQSLPVIVSAAATGGYVENRVHGLVVPENDAAALAEAVREMVRDGALRRRCVAQGLDVARRHTRERMQARIRELLHTALERAAPAPGATP